MSLVTNLVKLISILFIKLLYICFYFLVRKHRQVLLENLNNSENYKRRTYKLAPAIFEGLLCAETMLSVVYLYYPF